MKRQNFAFKDLKTLRKGALFLTFAMGLALSGCDASFKEQCRLIKVSDKKQSLGKVDSIEFSNGIYDKNYICSHLCFTILHRTGLPIVVKHSAIGEVKPYDIADNLAFYAFLQRPEDYEYRFVDSAKCRQWAAHDREPLGLTSQIISECVSVAPAQKYKDTVLIDFGNREESVREGPLLSYNRDLFTTYVNFYKSNQRIAQVKNIYYTDFLGHSQTHCIETGGTQSKDNFEMEDIILDLIPKSTT